MNRVFHIALREYVETTKTKIFLFSVFLTPLIIVGIVFFQGQLREKVQKGARPPKSVAVIDLSDELAEDIEAAFENYNSGHPNRKIVPTFRHGDEPENEAAAEQLKADVRDGALDGALVVARDVVEGDGVSRFYSKTNKIADLELFSTVERLLHDVVVERRFRVHDVSSDLMAKLRREVPIAQVDVMAEGQEQSNPFVGLITPFFFLFMMFMGVFGSSQGMLTSVIEEKNSRVIEVLLSAVSPFQLMVGKIAGLAAVGLTVVAIWATAAYWAAASQGFRGLISAGGVGYFLVYFVLGFVLVSAMFAAIGAACNTVKEAQALMTPLMLVFILPMITWFYIAQYPDGALALALSFFPPTTPMVMILRIAARPDLPLIQIVASIALLAVSVPVVVWVAAKVFRTGILMYGKPPSLRELVRWVRYR